MEEMEEGGFCRVFKAKNLSNGRMVAIKCLKKEAFHSNSEAWVYWDREASLTEKVRDYPGAHMDLIEAYKHKPAAHETLFYIVLSFVPNKIQLDKWLLKNAKKEKSQRFTLNKTIEKIFIPLCDFMYHAQQQGNIHRDFTFSNILIDETDENNPVPYVIDWGGGRHFDPETLNDEPPLIKDISGHGTLLFTPGFQAPEITQQAPPVPQTDIYMFGTLLFYTLTKGNVKLKPLLTTDYILNPKKYNASISEELSAIVEKCTQYEPKHRYRHFGEVKAALEEYLIHTGRVLTEAGFEEENFHYMLENLTNQRTLLLNIEEMVIEEGKNLKIRTNFLNPPDTVEDPKGLDKKKRKKKKKRRKKGIESHEQFLLGFSKQRKRFFIHEGIAHTPTYVNGQKLIPKKWIPIHIGQIISVEDTGIKSRLIMERKE